MSTRLALSVTFLVLAACAKDAAKPPYTTLPVARCGMASYQLLDPAGLGEVLESKEIDELNLDSGAVQALLAQTGSPAAPQVNYGSRVFQFRYTTQDRGQRVEATAVLGVPANADLPDAPFPSVVFLHGTTGFSDPCAPSRTTNNNSAATLMASLGFVTILPDYIGMKAMGAPSTSPHGYLVAEQVAIGSWDAVRAGHRLLQSLGLGVRTNEKVMVWGGSQGGHAAMFTGQWAPYYAPEFDVPGIVALVAPTTLAPLAQSAVTTWGPPTLSFASVLSTWRHWYGEGELSSVMTDTEPYQLASTIDSQVFVRDTCNIGEAYSAFEKMPQYQNPALLYQPGFVQAVQANDWAQLNPWACEIEENTLATTSVKPLRFTPSFLVYSQLDDLVITAPMREEFKHLCNLGYQLHYQECLGAGHTEGAAWSLPDQIAWVHDRLDGKPMTDVCVVHEPVCCPGSPTEICGGK